MKKYSLKQAQKDLPRRHRQDNKTRGGKCLIIAGGSGTWGAAVLCAKASARCGAGYTYIFDRTHKFPVHQQPDFLTTPHLKNILNFQSIALGPGFQDHTFLKKIISYLIKNNFSSVVLDAEALNILAQKPHPLPSHWIITPHEGELSRLIQVSSAKIRAQREKYLIQAQKKYGCIVVLKGHQTLIADSHGIWQNTTGNAALAKAGTGDVLTGMIAGFLSQKVPPLKAALLAVTAHGWVADQWIKKQDPLSLMASDIIDYLPEALKRLRKLK